MSKQYVCTACGYVGKPKKAKRGTIFLSIFLWLFFIIPGLLYSLWRMFSKFRVCPQCGNKALIPVDSPVGQKLVAQVQK